MLIEPLKSAMHWDEMYRYVFPGINQFHYSMQEVWQPIFGPVQNSGLILTLLRVLRNAFPSHSPIDHVVLAYKTIVLFLSAISLIRFCRTWTPSSFPKSVLTFLLCVFSFLMPEFWLQSNEVMTEPLCFAFSFFLFAEFALVLARSKSSKKVWNTSSFLRTILICWLFLSVSIQFFMACYGCAGAAAGITILLDPTERKKTVKHASYFLLVGLVSFLLWTMLHSGNSFVAARDLIKSLFSQANDDYPALRSGMNRLDVLIFGVRSVFWLYLPSLPLLSFLFFVPKREILTLSNSNRFLLLLSLIAVVIFSYGYARNIQDRYRYISSALLMVSICYFVILGGISLWLKSKLGRVFVIFVSASAITAYLGVFLDLPCFGNLEIYGPYRGDHGKCDQEPLVFGFGRKSWLVKFPHISYVSKFQNGNENIEHEVYEVVDTISKNLDPNSCPVAFTQNPNYLNTLSLQFIYILRFNQYPPCEKNVKKQWISVSLPKLSRGNSVVYELLNKLSEEEAKKEWTKKFNEPTPQILMSNRDFVIRNHFSEANGD